MISTHTAGGESATDWSVIASWIYKVAAGLALLLGFMTLVGWAWDVEVLRRFGAVQVAMNPLTAVGFLFCGLALLLLLKRPVWSQALGLMSAVFGFTRILGLAGWDLGLDLQIFSSQLESNRMAPNTAMCFVFTGLSILLSAQSQPKLRRVSDVLNLFTLVISLLTLTGYLYGAAALYGVSSYIPMALNTGIAFFLLSVGLFSIRPSEGIASVYFSRNMGGRVARQLMPVVILVPLILGGLRLLGQTQGWFDFEFGVSLLVAATVLTLGALTWRCARWLEKIDQDFLRQNEFFKSVLRSLGEGVVVTDASDAISVFNEAAQTTLNLELYRRDPHAWARESRLISEVESMDAAITLEQLLRGYENESSEFLFESPGGKRYLGLTSRPVLNGEGQRLGRVAVVRDITDFKRASQILHENNEDLERRIRERMTELQDARAQIDQLQKMNAVGRLAGGIAHDFNNILSAIQMCCDLLNAHQSREADRLTVFGVDPVEQIEDATQRGADLTRQLLTFSSKRVVERESVRVNVVVQDHIKMLRRLIGEDIEIDFLLAENLPMILADPSQIEQIVMNLAINARDAMANGGRITIETQAKNLSGESLERLLLKDPGPYVFIRVRDTGCGMDEQLKRQVFDPFFTTKPTGTGLGLSIVYGIVKGLNGAVWVESEPGHGSVFNICIPAAPEAAIEVAPPRRVRQLTGRESILVVEDEDRLCHLYAKTLAQSGYTVAQAKNGREAMEHISNQFHMDLILTDMVMPGMSGTELMQHALSHNPQVKVLCMSGFVAEAPGDLIASGPISYIQKPFKSKELLERVRDLLETSTDFAVSHLSN